MKLYKALSLVFFLVGFTPLFGTAQMDMGTIETIVHAVEDSTALQNETPEASENAPKEDAEIPLVFAQWWFWVGLIIIILFIKYVVFKK